LGGGGEDFGVKVRDQSMGICRDPSYHHDARTPRGLALCKRETEREIERKRREEKKEREQERKNAMCFIVLISKVFTIPF
jgi:hypothetical protein